MNSDKITLVDVVGSPYCVSSEDGQKVFELIQDAIKIKKKVKISFYGVDGLTSAFLNVAVGQLYGNFSEEIIKDSLSVSDINDDDKSLLKRVIDTAKIFYKDPKRYIRARDAALGNENE